MNIIWWFDNVFGYILEDFHDFVCEVDLVNLSTKNIVIQVELLIGILCLWDGCVIIMFWEIIVTSVFFGTFHFLAIHLKFYTETNNALRR